MRTPEKKALWSLITTLPQVLFWITFHPSAWKEFTSQIGKEVKSDFCIAQLSASELKSRPITNLIYSYITWMIVLFVLCILVYSCNKYTANHFIRHALETTTSIFFASLLIGFFVNVMSAMLLSALYVTINIVFLLLLQGDKINLFSRTFDSADCLTIVIATAFCSGALVQTYESNSTYSQIGSRIGSAIVGATLGVLVGSGFGSIGFAVMLLLIKILKVPLDVSIGFIALINSLILIFSRFRSKTSIFFYIYTFSIISIINAISILTLLRGFTQTHLVFYLILFGIVHGSWFGFGIFLSQRARDPWAQAVASFLGSGGGWLAVCIIISPGCSIMTKLIAGSGSVLGITHSIWRPILVYPFTELINWFLLKSDQSNNRPHLISRNSAFWDELQWIPLFGLDQHLVLTWEHDGAAGEAALSYIAKGRQRWAAQAAQIELVARRLERCADVAAIAQQARTGLVALAGPARALFEQITELIEEATKRTPYHQRLHFIAALEKINNRILEIRSDSKFYAPRFLPILEKWKNIVSIKIEDLLEDSKNPNIIVNPYIWVRPLDFEQKIFVGRTDMAQRIEQLLLDSQNPTILLYGQRRMGKTSFLLNLIKLLPRNYVPIFIDLQSTATAERPASFFHSLASDIADSAKKTHDIHLPIPTLAEFDEAGAPRFGQWLHQIEGLFKDRRILLCLDEFEALDGAFEAKRLSIDIVLGMLRHIIQHHTKVKILLAGSHTFQEITRWASYLINILTVDLGPLSKQVAIQLIEKPVENFSLRYEPENLDHVWRLTCGHPGLTQLLCYQLVDLKNEQLRNFTNGKKTLTEQEHKACLDDIEKAADAALEVGAIYFNDMKQQFDTDTICLARWLASHGEGALINRQQLLNHSPLKSDKLESSLFYLKRRNVIEETSAGLSFCVELIRRYFASLTD